MNHQIFCEMSELQSDLEWLEIGRWLKFEENVENGGRWSKPHVASLQFHYLLELRGILITETIILDLPGECLQSIIDNLVDCAVKINNLKIMDKEKLKNILLLKHLHQHEKDYYKRKSSGDINNNNNNNQYSNNNCKNKRNSWNLDMLQMQDFNDTSNVDMSKKISSYTIKSQNSVLENNSLNFTLSRKGSVYSVNSNISRIDFRVNQNFAKKISAETEACNVLVGEVDFLDEQFSVFVRLSNSVVLGDFCEVAIPSKFLFIILGPKGNITRYREIGRSISTLMSDELFNDIAYKAKSKEEIIDAFDIFLNQLIVLPPGEWDPNIRLDPPDKVLSKEERLEMFSDTFRFNSSVNDSIKGSKEEESDDHLDTQHEDLDFSGRLCGGLIEDVKRKIPWYWSDFKDGYRFQCISSILFMYFACLSPIITFGGLLGSATEQNMSTIESLLSSAVCGIIYSLFSGQPMTILGGTGPILIFEKILYQFSKEHDIDYMGFRAWIGLWITFMLILIVIFDGSVYVKYITRFTEETFAALIALFFIEDSIVKLYEINKDLKFSSEPFYYFYKYRNSKCLACLPRNLNNKSMFSNSAIVNYNETQCNKLGENFNFVNTCNFTPDVFFFSLLLYASTFTMAMMFRKLRTSRFFASTIRSKISDFGIVITILINILIDYSMKVNTPKLNFPLKFQTTLPNRGWFINPIDRLNGNYWPILIAIIPAFLATILIFMDQHITACIINRKENKLKKSYGYHLDTLVIAVTILINSLIGTPWLLAATVLSINNVLSLRKESETSAPGEKPKFLGIIEQRLTGTIIFTLIGFSIFLEKFLRQIPMPVLYGTFLYMGISSLTGMHFMQRLILIFMPEKHQPDHIFLRHVRSRKVHLFTLIQIICLVLLVLIKMNKSMGIIFPVVIGALVGVRKLMDLIFTQDELAHLDQVLQKPKIKKVNGDQNNHLEKNPIHNENETETLLENSKKKEKSTSIDENVKDMHSHSNNSDTKLTNVPTIIILDIDDDIGFKKDKTENLD